MHQAIIGVTTIAIAVLIIAITVPITAIGLIIQTQVNRASNKTAMRILIQTLMRMPTVRQGLIKTSPTADHQTLKEEILTIRRVTIIEGLIIQTVNPIITLPVISHRQTRSLLRPLSF